MPIYEYACESCGHVFDVLQKMDAAPLAEKVIVGTQFSSQGWWLV